MNLCTGCRTFGNLGNRRNARQNGLLERSLPLGLMHTAIGTIPAHMPHRKSTARVALFDLQESSSSLLVDCFRQFAMETVAIPSDEAKRLHREKFEACVLRLGPEAGSVIETARASNSNSRLVIYGLGGTAQDALQYSKYCLNAVFQEPLERAAALKLVRATKMLVQHEFRRYVRIPVMTEVTVVSPNGKSMATSQEISSGGMSLKSTHPPEPGSMVEVSFSLLTLPRVWVRGVVSWKKSGKGFGVRFDAKDDRRLKLKEWVVSYLET